MFDVITIGTATQDVLIKSEQFKVVKSDEFLTGEAECFALGSKIEIPDIIFSTGGGATNASVTFSRHELKTAVICKLGLDAAGEAVIKDLDADKIETKFVKKDKKGATAYSVILVAPSGERTVLVHRGISERLEEDDLPKEKDFNAKWLYIAPLAGENIKVFKPILEMAKKNNIKVAVDPSKDQIKMGLNNLRPFLRMIDVFKLNQEEAAFLTDLPFKEEKLIFKMLDAAIDGIVVMTKGPEGVVVSDGKTLWRAGVYKEEEVVDRLGAGDAFGSGFVASYLTTGDIETAIKFGSANATSKVEHMGAKAGLLRKKDFNDARWKDLEIKKEEL